MTGFVGDSDEPLGPVEQDRTRLLLRFGRTRHLFERGARGGGKLDYMIGIEAGDLRGRALLFASSHR